MVKKGLKVGETFTDNGLLYKVNSFDENGHYVSALVGKASAETKSVKVEAVAVKEEATDKNLEDMAYSDLKKIAKEKGVSAKGSKEEVIERLKGV